MWIEYRNPYPRRHHSFVTFRMGSGPARPPRSCVCRLHMLGHTMRVQNRFLANQAIAQNSKQHVLSHPAVAEYLANELKLNRMLGPFNNDVKEFQSVLPKGHGTGKWRLITDLSYPPPPPPPPPGSSVNDGIDLSLCSLRHT